MSLKLLPASSNSRTGRQWTAGARRLRICVGIAVLTVAVLGLALSWLPYEAIEERVGDVAADGDGRVTREAFDAVILRLRVVAAGLGGLALGLLLRGEALDAPLGGVLSSWTRSVRSAPRRLASWIDREPLVDLSAFAVVLAVAVAVRIAFLDVPLRYDEATTHVSYVSESFYVALSNYSAPNNHLLHTALAKLSVALFGDGPTALRLPALVAGVALVPATFVLARLLYGRAAGLLAAGFVAASSTLVEYSANARGYTIVALLTLIALIAATRVVDDDATAAWAVLALSLALGLYAVPVMLYPAGGILLWIAASRLAGGQPARPVLLRILGCSLVATTIAVLLYAPVLIASGPRSITSNEFVAPTSWADVAGRLPGHFWDTLTTWGRDLPTGVEIALAALLAASLLLTPRLSRYRIPPLVAIAAWSVPVLLAQRVVPFTRVWLFALPLAAIAVAGLVVHLVERLPRSGALIAGTAVVVSLAASGAVLAEGTPRSSRETGGLLDAPAVAAYLAGVAETDDRILATGSDTILQYYLAREGLDDASLIYTSEPRRRIFVVVNILGQQTVPQLLDQLGDERGAYDQPRLLRRWPSAAVYLLEHRSRAATR